MVAETGIEPPENGIGADISRRIASKIESTKT
jgi:hypothetical protein